MKSSPIQRGLVALAAGCASLAAAQTTPPTTGDVLRQVDRVVPEAPVKREGTVIELPRPLQPLPGGVQVNLRDLEIRGNTLFRTEVLRGAVQARGKVILLQNDALPCVPCQQEGCDRHRGSRAQCLDELPATPVLAAIESLAVHA